MHLVVDLEFYLWPLLFVAAILLCKPVDDVLSPNLKRGRRVEDCVLCQMLFILFNNYYFSSSKIINTYEMHALTTVFLPLLLLFLVANSNSIIVHN